MNTIKRHAIFHLPFDMNICAIKFARLLNKEGFNIYGNASFIARANKEGGIAFGISNGDSRRADTLVTVGDYSKNDDQFECTGNAYSIDIDVSSLENEIQMMWLVMIATRIRVRSFEEIGSVEDAANYKNVEPFLAALKAHKFAVNMRASEIARLDGEIKQTIVDVGETYRSSISHSLFIDRLAELAAEKPGSIYADIVAKLDTIPE